MNWHTELKRVLRLNTLESVVYHGILLCHQAALLYAVNYAFYGLIGTLFSIVYLSVSLVNFGLDATLGAFFKKICASKSLLRKTIAIQLIPQAIIFILCASVALKLPDVIPAHWARIFACPFHIIIICIALIFFESIRKLIRTSLQLSLMQRKTTLIEIASIIGYTATVWGWYSCTQSMTLTTVLLPMLGMSIISTAVLGYHAYQWHHQLPSLGSCSWHQAATESITFFKTRFFTFANQIAHTFFSSNVLVPIFAIQFGLHHAGIFKFISTVAYSISALLHKIFGHTSDVLLSQAKQMPFDIRRSLFQTITNRLHQLLYGLIIFLAINIKKIIIIATATTAETSWLLVYLFFIINITENFLITYERLYITEEKSTHLFMINGTSLLCAYLMLHITHCSSPLLALLCVAVFRAAAFLCVSILSCYLWHIKLQWKPQPVYTFFSLITSILFFLFVI